MRPRRRSIIWLLSFALLLAVRLLTPAGFMPDFSGDAFAVVACPDADGADMPMQTHGSHGKQKAHQPCPYASASSLGGLADGFKSLIADVIAIGAALLLGRTFLFLCRHLRHGWPPLRGPPIPA